MATDDVTEEERRKRARAIWDNYTMSDRKLVTLRKIAKEDAWVLAPAMEELAKEGGPTEDGEADPEPKR